MQRTALLFVLTLLFAVSCGNTPERAALKELQPAGFNALALPQDGKQPWEQLDSRGFVIPARSASALNSSSDVLAGIERFDDVGASEVGEALHLSAAPAGLAAGVYRLHMGGDPPGVVSVDANSAVGSHYYIGVSDYGAGSWDWHGPFTDTPLTLQLDAAGNHLSPLGNVFVAVLCHDGDEVDVVAVGATPRVGSDLVPPPTPAAPQLLPAAGGVEVLWDAVSAPDLAGYRVLYSYSPFSSPTDNGVTAVPYLEGTTRLLLETQRRSVWVAVEAVDTNGNGAVSPVVSAIGGFGHQVQGGVEANVASVARNGSVTLTVDVVGSELYDLDLDGDGDFELTNQPAGDHTLDTSQTGILRPRWRATEDGMASAMGGLSILISGGGRPVAAATATPQSGQVPLNVSFDGAESTDFDGTVSEYAWDVNGDGIYDTLYTDGTSTHSFNYTQPGTYNVKLRVTDNDGQWDVDTLAITAAGAAIDLTVNPQAVNPGERIELSATANEPVTEWRWDVTGDGTYDYDTGATPSTHTSFATPGVYTLKARAQFASGSSSTTRQVVVHGFAIKHADLSVEGNCRLLDVGGHPAMFFKYFDTGSGSQLLRYVRALDPAGETWGTPVDIATAFFIGNSTDLAPCMVQGRPAVAFNYLNELYYVRSDDATGTAWSAFPQHLGVQTGPGVSMQIVSGNPAIACTNMFGGVKYVRASDADGGSWPALQLAWSNPSGGTFLSLAVVNGNPAFIADRASANQAEYFRSDDAFGNSWPVANTAAYQFLAEARFLTLRVVNGKPAFACCDMSGRIYYSRSLDADGASAGGLILLAEEPGVNVGFNLVGGVPAVTWTNGSEGRQALVRALDGDGSAWGNPVGLLAVHGADGGSSDILDVQGRPGVGFTMINPFSNAIFGVVY